MKCYYDIEHDIYKQKPTNNIFLGNGSGNGNGNGL